MSNPYRRIVRSEDTGQFLYLEDSPCIIFPGRGSRVPAESVSWGECPTSIVPGEFYQFPDPIPNPYDLSKADPCQVLAGQLAQAVSPLKAGACQHPFALFKGRDGAKYLQYIFCAEHTLVPEYIGFVGMKVDTELSPSGEWGQAEVTKIEPAFQPNGEPGWLYTLSTPSHSSYQRWEQDTVHDQPHHLPGSAVTYDGEPPVTLTSIRTPAHYSWTHSAAREPCGIPGNVYGVPGALHINDPGRCRSATVSAEDRFQAASKWYGIKAPFTPGDCWVPVTETDIRRSTADISAQYLPPTPGAARHTPLWRSREAAEAAGNFGYASTHVEPWDGTDGDLAPPRPKPKVGDIVQITNGSLPDDGRLVLVTNITSLGDDRDRLEVSGRAEGHSMVVSTSVRPLPPDIEFGLKVLRKKSGGQLISPTVGDYLSRMGGQHVTYKRHQWQSIPGRGSAVAITDGLFTYPGGMEEKHYSRRHSTLELVVVAGRDTRSPADSTSTACTFRDGGRWFKEVFVTAIDPLIFLKHQDVVVRYSQLQHDASLFFKKL